MFDNRTDTRAQFVGVWRKLQSGALLQPLESVLAEVISMHPEYQLMLAEPDIANREFPPEAGATNPFLHMGLHIAIAEQVSTDRPRGIAAAYAQLVRRHADRHAAEHRIMECLAAALWQAQRDNCLPDEEAYLEAVRRLR